ncbi:TetR/AcrR family transcriptional regulator [Acinetobacter sp. ESBL14]|uniref:TetR/AcrR family transcriptional regulator n=1 Tax=Acinetobacter sp. ESBL14 TaxID=3077329 RepID=UPI002FC61834
MGRVSKVQATQNRSLILRTACRMFRKYGVETVSIADIMKAMGLTVGGFYKHFESKDALINEAFRLTFEQSSKKWDQLSQLDDPTYTDGLMNLVEHYLTDRPPEQNCPILSFSSQVSNTPDDSLIKQTYSHGVDELFEQFKLLAEKEISTNDIPRQNKESETNLLFAAMVGIGMLKRAVGETQLVDEMKSSLLNKIKKL